VTKYFGIQADLAMMTKLEYDLAVDLADIQAFPGGYQPIKCYKTPA